MGAAAMLIWILIGSITGWLAGLAVRGLGFGIAGKIVVGLLSAMIGGWLFGALALWFVPAPVA